MLSTRKVTSLSLLTALMAELLLIYIIYLNPHKIAPVYNIELQPWLGAVLNSLSAISLVIAVAFIKSQNVKWHIIFIHLALFFSALFLVNYIFYHLSVGHTKFQNEVIRPYYLVLLATHLIASFIALPMIFLTYGLGITRKLTLHKRIAKWTFGFWIYVSVTGVMIVFFLKFYHQA